MKRYLLVQTNFDLSGDSSPKSDLICRFIVFEENNLMNTYLLNNWYRKYIYEINLEQFNFIKKNDVSRNFTSLTKKDFFIQNNIEEKLI